MQSGIYAITNLVNGKRYIGSAADVNSRWRTHQKRLRENTHHTIALQRAYNKYGANNFKYEILYECSPQKDILLFYEQWFINLMGDYNSSRTAGSPLGYKHPEEEKKRRRIKRGCLPVYQFDLDGNLIAEYDSIVEAIEGTGIYKGNVRKSIKNGWAADGFIFTHDKNNAEVILSSRLEKIKQRQLLATSLSIESCIKSVIRIDTSGNVLARYLSLSDAARDLNVAVSSISISIDTTHTCLNSLFVSDENKIDYIISEYRKRMEELSKKGKKKIIQIDLKTGKNIRVWNSITEAANAVGAKIPNLSKVLKGERNKCAGFGWKFLE